MTPVPGWVAGLCYLAGAAGLAWAAVLRLLLAAARADGRQARREAAFWRGWVRAMTPGPRHPCD